MSYDILNFSSEFCVSQFWKSVLKLQIDVCSPLFCSIFFHRTLGGFRSSSFILKQEQRFWSLELIFAHRQIVWIFPVYIIIPLSNDKILF